MSYNQPFWYHLILIFHAQVISFGKKGVFVDFQKWPIMSKFITSCECIFYLGIWILIVGNLILFKISFGWVISHKVWESYAWSKLGWLFLQNPNLATFESWWILSNPWWIMINPWSNDEISFKMRMLTKNLEVWLYLGHSWLLP